MKTMKASRTTEIAKLASNMANEAYVKYCRCYDEKAFAKATKNENSEYASELENCALALCGSPYFKISYNWSAAAMAFLRKFAE